MTPPPTGRDVDAVLEARIDSLSWALPYAPTRDAKLVAWRCMVELIGRRTPQQIEHMERARGLR